MADTTIDIGFTVANDEFKAGLDQALQDFAATSAAIQEAAAGTAQAQNSAIQTKRIADQDEYAREVSNVEILRSLNQLSADEAIDQQRQIEDAKYAQIRDDLNAQNQAAGATIAIHEQVAKQLDQLALRHDATLRQLNQKEVAETMQAWQQMLQPIGNAFSSSLSGMITGQENFRQALANIGDAIVSDFVNMAVKRAVNWAASELTMTSASQAGDIARTASHQEAIATGKAVDAAASSVSVFGDANKAAAGAFSAVAGIPLIGPVLAPVAAVAAFTAVMAYDVFSAEGGFDIPAGLNPVTQLHEREMVLPASIAEPLRAGLNGGGAGGGDIHIHAVDAASFQRLLSNNKGALARALRGAHRNFDPALA